jgi:hypothetical protein
MRFNIFQWGVLHGLGWFIVLTDGWITHTHYLAVAGFALMIYSMWRMTMKTDEDDEFDRIEREIAMRTCQVCRLRPAEVQGKNSNGAPQWRCQTCHDLKSRGDFTKGKQ